VSFDPILPCHPVYQASNASYHIEASIYQSGPSNQFVDQANRSQKINLEVISSPQAPSALDYHACILTLANLIDSFSFHWGFSLSLNLPTSVTSSRQTTTERLIFSLRANPNQFSSTLLPNISWKRSWHLRPLEASNHQFSLISHQRPPPQ